METETSMVFRDEENTPQENPPAMLLVMGVTGAGKSMLINKLAGGEYTASSDSVFSCTSSCTLIPALVGNTRTCLIDTPGFDDTFKTDAEILEDISKMLTMQYELKLEHRLKLHGVLYLHRITDNRYTHSAMKTLMLFNKICGKDALKNVILVTTHWDLVDPVIGAKRESEIRDHIWNHMLDQGATMARYYGDRDSAVGFASTLLSKEDVVLDLQRELVDEHKNLIDTAVGASLNENLEELKARFERELSELQAMKEELLRGSQAQREQMQFELEQERRKLQEQSEQTRQQQRVLHHNPAEEVSEAKKKSKMRYVYIAAKATGYVVDVIGMFVGIPPGLGSLLTSWF